MRQFSQINGQGHAADIGSRRQATRVLVVEDNPKLRQSLAALLEYYGYAVTMASNYEQALQVSRTAPPHVAVCDRQLDGRRDGIEVARELQKRFDSAVVFVSGTSVDKLRAESVDLDVIAYISKPALPREIAAAVKMAAASRRKPAGRLGRTQATVYTGSS